MAEIGRAQHQDAAVAERDPGSATRRRRGWGFWPSLVRREAYVLAYIDAFWLIAGVTAAGILLVLLLRPPPFNPLTPPPSGRSGGGSIGT